MYDRVTRLFLRWLRVPPEPHPPHGDPASLRVFRAGKNYLNLRLLRWGVAQIGAFVGIVFWFGVFSDIGDRVEQERRRRPAPPAASQAPATATPSPAPGGNAVERTVNSLVTEVKSQAKEIEKEARQSRQERRKLGPLEGFRAWRAGMARFLARLPPPAMLVIWFFEIGGLLLYVVQLPVTFLLARMDYDLRWYMVTDRSLRIRHGVWRISESTMSFANIQQVVVSQGPLQRLLGLWDLKVQSAGGGGGSEQSDHHRNEDDMHLGLFHSVNNADEIRDLILDRLRRYRESGLGDPEEKSHASAPAPGATTGADDLLAAARDLAAEAKALRTALSS
jgi:membrane protein YdbS with pleckstrin-like domain